MRFYDDYYTVILEQKEMNFLPMDVIRLVHSFLVPNTSLHRQCALHDHGLCLRMASATLYNSLHTEEQRCCMPCTSVYSVVHKTLDIDLPAHPKALKLNETVVNRIYDVHGVTVKGKTKSFCAHSKCIVHDCCAGGASAIKMIQYQAQLSLLLTQLKSNSKVLTCTFESWNDLSAFVEMMGKAGVSIYGYKPYVTRDKRGIRVSWMSTAYTVSSLFH